MKSSITRRAAIAALAFTVPPAAVAWRAPAEAPAVGRGRAAHSRPLPISPVSLRVR
ncbi:hypothetical protein [Streptomyces megasporus]|uniref:hypothetical protein n=1 Tax=Streptomyces megasporus TaxID=44060 RepID=UPI000A7D12A8|nr:hypothetical protein [Streptomyces megasporus]